MARRILLAALLLPGLAVAIWFLRPAKKSEIIDPVYPDPRVSFETPFQNVRPEVQYVGSKTCTPCHTKEAGSYAKHPMGRAFAALAEVENEQVRYDAASHNPFETFGNVFSVERQGQRTVHKVRRPGPGSEVFFELASDVEFVMGSGSH